MTTSVAVLPGSIRAGSVNARYAQAIGAGLRARSVEVDLIDLADDPMPIYDADVEERDGPPVAAHRLHDRLRGHHGLIIVSPEYNGGPPALLKNAIDWVSRVDRSVLSPMLHGIAAATPGRRGGRTVIAIWKLLYDHMRLDAHPGHLSLGRADEAFDDIGLARAEDRARLDAYLDGFVSSLRMRAAA